MAFMKKALQIILGIGAAGLVVLWVLIQSHSQGPSLDNTPTHKVVYASSCGVSLNLDIEPNWLEGDAVSIVFYYDDKGKRMQVGNDLYLGQPESLSQFPEMPIETRALGDGPRNIFVLQREVPDRPTFEKVADCMASNLKRFDDALAAVGSELPSNDRSVYKPYTIGALVYVP